MVIIDRARSCSRVPRARCSPPRPTGSSPSSSATRTSSTEADGRTLTVRPENLRVEPAGASGADAQSDPDGLLLRGTVAHIAYRGADLLVTVDTTDDAGSAARLVCDGARTRGRGPLARGRRDRERPRRRPGAPARLTPIPAGRSPPARSRPARIRRATGERNPHAMSAIRRPGPILTAEASRPRSSSPVAPPRTTRAGEDALVVSLPSVKRSSRRPSSTRSRRRPGSRSSSTRARLRPASPSSTSRAGGRGPTSVLISDYYAALGQEDGLFQEVDAAPVPNLARSQTSRKKRATSVPRTATSSTARCTTLTSWMREAPSW